MYQWVFESTFKRGQINAVEGMVCTLVKRNSLFRFQPPCSCVSTLMHLIVFSNTYLLHCWMPGNFAKRSWHLLHLPPQAWCMHEGNLNIKNDFSSLPLSSISKLLDLTFLIDKLMFKWWMQCCYGHCQTTFHPSCARRAGLYMNVRPTGGKAQHKAYCEKHSLEQKAKVWFGLL